MLRTLVPVRTNETVVYADALASVKVGPYTFLAHRDMASNGEYFAGDRYMLTYAPVGLRAGGPYNTIEEAIAKLLTVDLLAITKAIDRAIQDMETRYMPMLAPESGREIIPTWQEREQYRFDTGEYQPIPYLDFQSKLGLLYPQEHYAHLSVTKTESDFIAYTPSVEYGERDRQVKMKFGKYLRKCFPDMPDTEVQAAVMALRSHLALAESPATLYFATDRETINEIFETAMCACDSTYVSCMHGKFNDQVTRPYHVYADSPDVAVAYVREHGAIVSRSVVSTKDHRWIRLYSVEGDSTKCGVLRDLLKTAGYTRGDLTGNRLTKLQTCGVMLPYIDNGGMGVVDAGKYWEVCDEGEGDYQANQTDGTAEESTPQCERCERDQDDCICIYCECCEESYADGCDRCSMCPVCDQCTEHDNCSCSRCDHCGELISVPSRYRHSASECECERCPECAELVRDCDCVKCEDCGELEENCECTKPEESEETTETEGATA